MRDNEQATGWSGGKNTFGDFAPGMVHYTDKVLFDEVWERPELSKRDRSLVTVAALTAMGKMDQLQFHLTHAQTNGVTVEELKEALLHLAFYAGWPNNPPQSLSPSWRPDCNVAVALQLVGL
ncbi:carboxymuconolactone decarboxylase family protein [Paenarthrobacter sp. RAF54_2]|uniref:carboxymuconolactone decarboxylase family protein n=1 Tax=Paenarthrobacter sp. RAF54_2 TaxID=3233061 RepID=UPI003F98D969